MNSLEGYLKKFEKFLTAPKVQKETFITAVKNVAGITLEGSSVEIKDFTVYLKTSPAVRNTIYMNKKKILEELEKALSNKSPKNIR